MTVTMQIEGMNLEKLLRQAQNMGITLTGVQRETAERVYVRLSAWEAGRLIALCGRFGWNCCEIRADRLVRLMRCLRQRKTLCAGAVLCILLVGLSSQMILGLCIEGNPLYGAEIRRFLKSEGIFPGRLKASVPLDMLEEKLRLRLPGLSFLGLRYEGSWLLADCHEADEGEQYLVPGKSRDIVAAQAGIVTRISAVSGTPVVEIGQAVHRGQLLIAGQEKTEKGGMRSVQAQGRVLARVWAEGEAKTPLYRIRTVETGQIRTSVSVVSPWHRKNVIESQPFPSQDVSIQKQPVVGLFLPVWREIRTFAETVEYEEPRSLADAVAQAQGAAESIARKRCPHRTEILEKWVQWREKDEYVAATVILEYQCDIAARPE